MHTSHPISLSDIAGIFIVLGTGIGAGCVCLVLEYCFVKYFQRRNESTKK